MTGLLALCVASASWASYLIGASQGGGIPAAEASFSSDSGPLPIARAWSSEQIREHPSATASTTGDFVASKKGTKYHRIDCPGAGTIKSENRVYFRSQEDARNAGYLPAGNCPGLE